MLREHEARRTRPQFIALGGIQAFRWLDVGAGDGLFLGDSEDFFFGGDAGGHHLAREHGSRIDDLGEAPVNRAGARDRDPVNLGRSQAGVKRGVVDGGHTHELRLVGPRLDGVGLAGAAAHDKTVVEHAVLLRVNTRHERRVIGPSNRGIRDGHRIRDDALGGETAKMGQREGLVAPEIGGETVEGDQDDVAVFIGRQGVHGRGGGEGEERPSKAAEQRRFHASETSETRGADRSNARPGGVAGPIGRGTAADLSDAPTCATAVPIGLPSPQISRQVSPQSRPQSVGVLRPPSLPPCCV